MTTLDNHPGRAGVDSAEHQAQLAELYRDLAAVGMAPLWTVREELMASQRGERAPSWRSGRDGGWSGRVGRGGGRGATGALGQPRRPLVRLIGVWVEERSSPSGCPTAPGRP